MKEELNVQAEERSSTRSWQFGVTQILLGTAVSAIVVACVKYLPEAIVATILIAFIYVPIGPFAILFATIAFGREKKGYLSVNHGSVRILVAAWVICVIVVVVTCLLLYWGLMY